MVLNPTVIRLKLRHYTLEKGTGPSAPTKKIFSREWLNVVYFDQLLGAART